MDPVKRSTREEADCLSLMAQNQMPYPVPPQTTLESTELASISALDAQSKKELHELFYDENGTGIATDDLLIRALQLNATLLTSLSQLSYTNISNERNFLFLEEEKRTKAYESHYDSLKKANAVDNVTKALTSFGLMASGVVGLATGVTILPLGAVAIGGCILLDQLLDDRAKKLVASWITRGGSEEQQVWVERINLCLAITSAALSLGIAQARALEIGMSIAQTACTGTKGMFDWKISCRKALIAELDGSCKENQKYVESLILDLQKRCNDVSELYNNLHTIEKRRGELAAQLTKI